MKTFFSVTCLPLDRISSVIVRFGREENFRDYDYDEESPVGTEVQFICCNHKPRAGSPRAVCTAEGTWSHTQPRCSTEPNVGSGCGGK